MKQTLYCQWDAISSCLLPFLLMLALGYANQEAKLEEDKKLYQKYDDVKKIINSLSTGITITKDIYDLNLNSNSQTKRQKPEIIFRNDFFTEFMTKATSSVEEDPNSLTI